MSNNSILIMFHCDSNARYSIDTLLSTFYKMALGLVVEVNNIHISFVTVNNQHDLNLDNLNQINIIEFDPSTNRSDQCKNMQKYVEQNNIDLVFGFDLPVNRKCYKYLRNGGVKNIVSYWGAPMSSLNSNIKLWIKKIEVALLHPNAPDIYIFESNAMAKTAYMGRGVNKNKTKVIGLGVDTNKYIPNSNYKLYAYKLFGIPEHRKIIYYSGHMEERKGVMILMKLVNYMVNALKRNDFHLLILGNRDKEADIYLNSLEGDAIKFVSFAGYRTDVEKILPSCYVGVIASTGWDSFTVSSLEMASAGLPLIVSNLQGLSETIEDEVTGYRFKPGDYKELSTYVIKLLENATLQEKISIASRKRIIKFFDKKRQIKDLIKISTDLKC